MNEAYRQAAEIIADSKNLIALTGAGISVESGIPDFRSPGGLWEKFNPEVYASIESFNRMPGKVWDMIFEMVDLMLKAKPNPAHHAVSWLENHDFLKSVITQNVDNLHQEAGSSNIIEYHGNATTLSCLKCEKDYSVDEFKENILKRKIPMCPGCDRILKPAVVFFGEMIPNRTLVESQFFAESADAVIVAGTSAIVYPAAGIPVVAKNSGAKIIEFNLEETEYTGTITDVFVQGSAGETMPAVIECLKDISGVDN